VRSVRIADADIDREPRPVSAAEAIEDLEETARVFAEAYAGVDGAPRTPAPERIADARSQILDRARWEPADLARLLADIFRAPDGHLAFGYGGRAPLRIAPGARRQMFVSEAPIERVDADGALWLGEQRLSGCAIDPRGGALVPTPEGRFVISVFDAEPAPLACRAAGGAPALLPLRPARAARVAGRPVSLERRGDVPVLAIRTFDNAAAAALDTLPAMAAELRRAPAFVVDLRGNGGGNYLYAERFLLALTSEPVRRLDEREVISVAAAEGRANSARRRLLRGDVPASAEPRFLEHIAALEQLAGDLRARGAQRTELVTAGQRVRGHADGPLRSRAVILVDRGCASACEMLLSLARQLPSVVVAGQSTRGGMAVGEVALFQLPRSGVQVSLGTRAFRDPLGDFEETRGFLPDVWIEGPDPVEEAVGLGGRGGLPAGEAVLRGERRARRGRDVRHAPGAASAG
jgi:hypothetical protein